MEETVKLLDYAIEYGMRGKRVFPCSPQNKRPLIEGGFRSASSDLDQIEEWWRNWPHASIGLATGELNDITVIDFDLKSNGLNTLTQLLALYPEFKKGKVVRTGGGGYHFYFKFTDEIKSTVNKLPGMDTRSNGGYVIAPPSLHSSGKRYEEVSNDQL